MSRFAIANFFDDIRLELGGKISLMGIYQSDLLVPNNPTVIPKLCCKITVTTSLDQPFRAASFRVRSDETVLVEQVLPSDVLEGLAKQVRDNEDPEDPFQRISLIGHLIITPLLVDKSFTIKAEAVVDGEVLPAGRLKIGFAAPWFPGMHGQQSH
ncbi:hypothetical protein LGN04_29190 [Burkholderia multivorans]|uniref:hypothetical protein n=1 Tax=Burkholderia multivorans TaxID=87883 RepID=UPI000CFF6A50|nr:hypothetical protein [Burkholderia multivorans]MBU9598150.1 hypothetical protein [Burkholderia multivorans]MBU9648331.1 hypothetical protein [Burkholderia multivorans]MCA8457981.1 hypothetical protein [Burkholderia multivorans]MCA8485022.1 hypothetical protein [Burkholderia multivorans]MDN7873712.1 hypothetical protein [Burkholderia multivorans]